MRLAAFNVENLFDRAKALNLADPADGTPILQAFARLNILLAQVIYDAAAKTEMADLIATLELEASDTGPFVILRRNRGALLRRRPNQPVEIVAAGRADWVGSLELRTEPLNAVGMRSTARVLVEVGADVLGIVEAEDRPALAEFNKALLPALGGAVFAQVMLIDGNDGRGIDVGLLTRPGFAIGRLRSHVDDRGADGLPIFSRDCPEFEVTTPAGNSLLVLVNHFKSKAGNQTISNRLRRSQADRVKAIYEQRRAEGIDNIAIIGDLNDTPGSAPLAPLLTETDLADISAHPAFDDGGFPGTFGSSTAANKIDYILLSPALFAAATGGGIFRMGMWPGVRPQKWPKFPEITRPIEAASDHGAIFADLDI
jgi:endonuclease/exonuclease/phosphatase family metal-dependent hydrolase